MIYDRVRSLLPAPLARYVMHFETAIEERGCGLRGVAAAGRARA